ncbi:butyrophilin-like protein 2 [Centroberyx affinis]|uniref:butyrophilin-like protein 2 n=1 Tax=Centroberyx affinis TaxID=166261 RepID=UPI003A5BA968
MLHLKDGLSLKSQLRPIVAVVGEDIILPCHLEPAMDADAMTLEWARPDLTPRFVHVWRDGRELVSYKNPSYEGRTSLFIDKLKHGDISLKLSKVKLSDEGKYRCFIPSLGRDSITELVVGAVSLPVIGITKDSSGVVLGCESKGWYPEPEVFWLDGEGNILSAGPTETVRGPDGLYTVSSRVTVEKTDTNRFTCRVQQQNINQTRETHIHIPGQPQVIGPPQPIVAVVGDDIILPCHLEPAMDAVAMTLQWARPDLNPRFVHVWRDGQELDR